MSGLLGFRRTKLKQCSRGEIKCHAGGGNVDFVLLERWFDHGSEHDEGGDVAVREREEEHDDKVSCVNSNRSISKAQAPAESWKPWH